MLRDEYQLKDEKQHVAFEQSPNDQRIYSQHPSKDSLEMSNTQIGTVSARIKEKTYDYGMDDEA